jgi:ribonucleoside-diphosphate reductase alpha chain
MFLDDTACNLASINLMRYMVEGGPSDGDVDIAALRHACTCGRSCSRSRC